MKKIIYALVLAYLPISLIFSQTEEKQSAFQFSFIPPLSTQGLYASQYTNTVSFNLLAGVSKNVTAFSLSGLGMYVTNDMRGFQMAGLSNIASGDMSGFQFAGLANVAGDVNGFQFAGLINIAKNVRGVQFAALVNIAENNDYPLGLVNIIKNNGEMSIGVTYNEIGSTMVSFRSGGRILYGIIGVGVNHKATDNKFIAEGGLGGHIPVSSRFRINNELKAGSLSFTDDEETFHSSFAVMPAFKILPQWEIFGGPSLNYLYTDNIDNKKMFPGNDIWKKYTENKLQQLYFGFSVGTHFIF